MRAALNSILVALILLSIPDAMAQSGHAAGMHGFIQDFQHLIINRNRLDVTAAAAQSRTLRAGVVSMAIHQCVEQAVGADQLDRVLSELQQTGKQVEQHCRRAEGNAALQLALAEVKARQHDPVTFAARNCYQEYKMDLEPVISAQDAADFDRYERWLADPALAAREAKPTDICK